MKVWVLGRLLAEGTRYPDEPCLPKVSVYSPGGPTPGYEGVNFVVRVEPKIASGLFDRCDKTGLAEDQVGAIGRILRLMEGRGYDFWASGHKQVEVGEDYLHFSGWGPEMDGKSSLSWRSEEVDGKEIR